MSDKLRALDIRDMDTRDDWRCRCCTCRSTTQNGCTPRPAHGYCERCWKHIKELGQEKLAKVGRLRDVMAEIRIVRAHLMNLCDDGHELITGEPPARRPGKRPS